MKYYKRTDCRLCSSTNLDMVLALTPTPPADSYIPSDQLGESQKVIPLDLYLCANCGNTQLGHVIDGNEVYLNYIYETASTLGLDHHFEVCADTIMKKFQPGEGGLVIDIGSNDGCLLKLFKDSGMKVLGIDPMPGIAEKATQMGIPTISAFFTQEYAEELKRKYGVASIVTSNNLVADTDDLVSFIRGIRSLMDNNSIFFFETFYLYLQIQNHVWDFTYHEHYSYLSVRPLVRFFRELGMEIIDIEPNETKGGSMRLTLQLEDGTRKVSDSVQLHINKEIEKGLQTKKVFKEYGVAIEKGKLEYLELIRGLKDKGNTLVGYGASATSTTLMYHYDMEGTLEFLVDDFEAKHNLHSPGMHIPVYPSGKIYESRPDYVVILAWRYYEKIISRHQEYLDSGGHFIVPLPELRVI